MIEVSPCYSLSLYREEDEQSVAKYEEELKAFEDSNKGGFRLVLPTINSSCCELMLLVPCMNCCYRRIYPENNNEQKYSELFEQSSSLCAETAASKARNELAK